MATEREEEKKENENKSKEKEKEVILKESAYSLCPIHKVQYPRGAKCPQC